VESKNNTDFCEKNKQSVLFLLACCKKYFHITDEKNYYYIRPAVKGIITQKNKLPLCDALFKKVETLFSAKKKVEKDPSTHQHQYDTRNKDANKDLNCKKQVQKKQTDSGIDYDVPIIYFPIKDLSSVEEKAIDFNSIHFNPTETLVFNKNNTIEVEKKTISLKDVDRICRTCHNGQDFSRDIMEFWHYWMTQYDQHFDNKDYYVTLPSVYDKIKK
jgi:hypothetical protein